VLACAPALSERIRRGGGATKNAGGRLTRKGVRTEMPLEGLLGVAGVGNNVSRWVRGSGWQAVAQ